MSITLYFGLPGCGKTTLLAKRAFQESRRISRHRSPYSRIFGNIPLSGIDHYEQIRFSDLGRYMYRDALILIDEASLEVDARNYKNFPEHTKRFILLHRHYRVDICFYNQRWDGMDLYIRTITDRVYYVYKSRFISRLWLSRMYRVPYGIIIPSKKDDNQKLGEIIQGYCKPSFLVRLFSPVVFRPRYYKYFDSFSVDPLPDPPKQIAK